MSTPALQGDQTTLTTVPYQWQSATWEDYLALLDNAEWERLKVFFNNGWLWFNMGGEGINHAAVNRLFTMLFTCWVLSRVTEQPIADLGGCQLEKASQQKAAAPDLVLYLGEPYPIWEPGQRRYIDLDRWRLPDLVGEISDTTLATDLDEKKQLYAELQIPEYWVIDVQGRRVIAFQLQDTGRYRECKVSQVLVGLSIALLEQTLNRLDSEPNTAAALWFSQQLQTLST